MRSNIGPTPKAEYVKPVLVLHPIQNGGVRNYLASIARYLGERAAFLGVGRRSDEAGVVANAVRVVQDIFVFSRHIKFEDCKIVHINPSLDLKALLRDGTFAYVAQRKRKKVCIFFHGWKDGFAGEIDRRYKPLFRLLYGKADCFIVLATRFREKLRSWGIDRPVFVDVTVVDDMLLKGFCVEEALAARKTNKPPKILFLSRVIREKGIFQLIEAIGILHRKGVEAELIVAGAGADLAEAEELVHRLGLYSVQFVGHVEDIAKRALLESANVFCLPSYSEGFPIAVSEAMAFGLPVVTRPVGGLVDFFEDGVHGFMTESLDPQGIAGLMERLLTDKALWERVSLHNYRYAQAHFLASDAAGRLQRIYDSLLDDSRVTTGTYQCGSRA